MKIKLTTVYVDDQEKALHFYTDVLGFTVRARTRAEVPGGATLHIVYIELGGTTVELMNYEGVAPGPAPTGLHLGYNLIALEVEDMAKALDYLKGKGVPVVWGPMIREKQFARAEITDPNGYHIELRQWY